MVLDDSKSKGNTHRYMPIAGLVPVAEMRVINNLRMSPILRKHQAESSSIGIQQRTIACDEPIWSKNHLCITEYAV